MRLINQVRSYFTVPTISGFFVGGTFEFMNYLWVVNDKIQKVNTDYVSMTFQIFITALAGAVVGNTYKKVCRSTEDSSNFFSRSLHFVKKNYIGISMGIIYELFDWLWVITNKDNLVDNLDRVSMAIQMPAFGLMGGVLQEIHRHIDVLLELLRNDGRHSNNYGTLLQQLSSDEYNNPINNVR